jgi:hypothetical protein
VFVTDHWTDIGASHGLEPTLGRRFAKNAERRCQGFDPSDLLQAQVAELEPATKETPPTLTAPGSASCCKRARGLVSHRRPPLPEQPPR